MSESEKQASAHISLEDRSLVEYGMVALEDVVLYADLSPNDKRPFKLALDHLFEGSLASRETGPSTSVTLEFADAQYCLEALRLALARPNRHPALFELDQIGAAAEVIARKLAA